MSCYLQKLLNLYVPQTKIMSQFQKQPPEVFYRIEMAALKNFTIFTGKHMCWFPVLIDLQASRPATSLKRDSNTGAFL